MRSYLFFFFLLINGVIFSKNVVFGKNYWFFLWSFLFSIAFYFLLLPFFFFISSFIVTKRIYRRIKQYLFLPIEKGSKYEEDLEVLPLYLIRNVKENLTPKIRKKLINMLLPNEFQYFLEQGRSIYFYQEEKTTNFLNFSPNGVSLIREKLIKSLKKNDNGSEAKSNFILTSVVEKDYFQLSLLFLLNFIAGFIIIDFSTASFLYFFDESKSSSSTSYIPTKILLFLIMSFIFIVIQFFLSPYYINSFLNKSIMRKFFKKKLVLQNLSYKKGNIIDSDLLLPINLSILKQKYEKNLYPYVFTNFSEIFSFALLGVRVFLPDSLTSNIVLKIDSKGLTFFKIKDDKLEEIV